MDPQNTPPATATPYTAPPSAGQPVAPGSYTRPGRRPHGGEIRGENLSRRSPQFEGRFGRLFRTLPAAHFTAGALKKLAEAMTAEFEAVPTPETEDDDEENFGIRAGYTYLGQFIDHDLTFDPASSLQKQNDPDGLTDFRTPRFDLDCVYGRGPDDQPYLYEDDGVHFLLGKPLTGVAADPKTRDLPRNTPKDGQPARALIGDPRNDENTIVSQLQSTMLRFHNRVADYLTQRHQEALKVDATEQPPTFAEIQRVVRWHYQWVVVHDFLPTIVGKEMVDSILPPRKNGESLHGHPPNLHFFKWKETPYMPIEFAAAVYRFGHSMIRPIYRLNEAVDRIAIFTPDDTKSLSGFKAVPSNHAVDWNLFFEIEPRPDSGPKRVQRSYKIDTSLVNPLGHLPPEIAKDVVSLAERNLLRGWRMGLPSGQAVARYMGVKPLTDAQLTVGKANMASTHPKPPDLPNPSITKVSQLFAGNAPLWYYILAEAQQQFRDDKTPIHLGPVGGRIVAEVFIGLLWGDSHSYLQQDADWTPLADFQVKGKFGMAELIRQARLA